MSSLVASVLLYISPEVPVDLFGLRMSFSDFFQGNHGNICDTKLKCDWLEDERCPRLSRQLLDRTRGWMDVLEQDGQYLQHMQCLVIQPISRGNIFSILKLKIF